MRETVSRWLNNPGWGWDEYVETRTRYVIDITQLHDKFKQHIELFCEQIRKALSAQVDVCYGRNGDVLCRISLCLTGLQEKFAWISLAVMSTE